MEESKKFLKKMGIVPFLSFKDGESHTVKLLKDKIDTLIDSKTGEEKTGIRYLVEKNGEIMSFFTTSPSLISKLSTIEPNEVINIQMKSIKTAEGFRNKYLVNKVGEKNTSEDLEDLSLEDLGLD